MKNIAKKDGVEARLVGKMEAYQSLCSVKDRSALRMIEDAEEKGLISPGVTTLIEPTSGNQGIGMVFIAVQKGYRFIAVMPPKYSLDKQILLRFLGAELILTDPANGFKGMIGKVEELMKTIPNSHCLNQVTNPANPGPEIWKDTAGKLDMFVAAVGSGGTLTGVGKYLKMKNPSIKIVCVEPSESAVISGGSPGSHKIQGTGPGFISEVLDTSVIDEVVTVSTEEAGEGGRPAGRHILRCKRSCLHQGNFTADVHQVTWITIFAGRISYDFVGLWQIAAREENQGKMIVTIFPSAGERYMNSDLFALVREECDNMTF